MSLKNPLLIAAALLLSVLLPASLALADTGGPDAGGYRFIDSNEPNGPTFNYRDISTTGTPVFPGGCDDCVFENVPLGFTFEFYGVNYTAVTIQSNGVLLFGDDHLEATEYDNESISTSEFEAAIMAFWDDLYPGPCEDTDVYYQQLNGMFITQWKACHYDYYTYYDNDLGEYVYPDPCTIDVQVILHRGTNTIVTQYLDTIFNSPACDVAYDNLSGTSQGSSVPAASKPRSNEISPADAPDGFDNGQNSSVGIQESSDSGLQYSYYGERPITDGLAICFYPEDVNSSVCGPEIRREPQRPPNIGAGLSGLFNGQPTPLPTAPSAVAPAATSPVITPPRTGDAGLVDNEDGYAMFIIVGAFTLGIALAVRRRLRA